MADYFKRETLANLDSKLSLRFQNWQDNVSQLEAFKTTLAKDAAESLRAKKMGRNRCYRKWINAVDNKIVQLKEINLVSLDIYGVF